MLGGLSTGEGLIWQIRDASDPRRARTKVERELANEDGMFVEDPGVSDKRLLVSRTNGSSARAMKRETNTLSSILRVLSGFRRLPEASPRRYRSHLGTPISLIGHITADELRRTRSRRHGERIRQPLSVRLLRRARSLPDGGTLADGVMETSPQTT